MDRAAIIILENDELMLIKRIRAGQTYYLFPGGGVEEGETTVQTAIREAREELGLDVTIGRLVAVAEHEGNHQYHFLATVTGGEFGNGNGAEFSVAPGAAEGTYRPVRIALRSLTEHDIRPRELAEAIFQNRIREGEPVLNIQN